jgi:hypothetical protein
MALLRRQLHFRNSRHYLPHGRIQGLQGIADGAVPVNLQVPAFNLRRQAQG